MKINKNVNARVTSNNVRVRIPEQEYPPKVSIFENYFATEPLGEISLWRWLGTRRFQYDVETYRRTKDESRGYIKKNMPCITPSGTFSQRGKRFLKQHNHCLCIDIDGKDNPNIQDEAWDVKKLEVAECFKSLYYAGLSISGNGIYLIFHIAYPGRHKEQFNALCAEIKERTGLVADPQCCDVGRLRIASYDPQPYFNPEAPAYGKVRRDKFHAMPNRDAKQMDKIDGIVNRLIHKISRDRVDITNSYNDWFACGQALASEYGQEGIYKFHLISMHSSKYDPWECDQQYSKCLKCCNEVTIKTFFFICKKHGVTFK